MKKDIYIVAVFFVFLLSFTYYLSTSRGVNLGAEYNCIANALVRGEGFSDPFCSPLGNSGKTAWMPPFLSYYQAFIYIISGQRTIALIWALILISTAAASFSLLLILRLANEVNSRFRHLCVMLFLGYLLINPNSLLLSFHDVWLISLASTIVLYLLYFHFIKKTLSLAPLIGLALFLPLISPILTFAFACLTGLIFLRGWASRYLEQKKFNGLEKAGSYSIYKLMIIILAIAIPVIAWGSRNYKVFNKFIPVKSNLWFDFYQANVSDEDGLITAFTFANFHPFKNKEKLKEYQQVGEIELMDQRKRESLSYLIHHTPEYLEKIKNRLFTTFIISKNPFDESHKIDEQVLTASDIFSLKSANIVSSTNSLNMQLSENTFKDIVADLKLENKPQLTAMWRKAKTAYDKQYHSPYRLLDALLISGIPFLAWIISLFFTRHFTKEGRSLFFILSVFYISYLFPYIMVTIYTRYMISISAVFTLLLYFVSVLICNRIFPANAQEELPEISTTKGQLQPGTEISAT